MGDMHHLHKFPAGMRRGGADHAVGTDVLLASKRLKSDKPVRRDCIAASAIVFLVGIIAIPAIMFMVAVKHTTEAELTFQNKLPSHQAVEQAVSINKEHEVGLDSAELASKRRGCRQKPL